MAIGHFVRQNRRDSRPLFIVRHDVASDADGMPPPPKRAGCFVGYIRDVFFGSRCPSIGVAPAILARHYQYVPRTQGIGPHEPCAGVVGSSPTERPACRPSIKIRALNVVAFNRITDVCQLLTIPAPAQPPFRRPKGNLDHLCGSRGYQPQEPHEIWTMLWTVAS